MIVPHIPPESSIGYCRTRLSVTFTKLSLIAEIVPQYLVFGLLEATFQAGDNVVISGLSDMVADLLGLGTVDEVFPQPFDNLAEILLKILLGTVVVDQVFDHEARELIDPSIDGEPLVDDFPPENVFEVCIHALSFLPQPGRHHAHDAVEFTVQATADTGCIELNIDGAVDRGPQCTILPAVAGDGRHLLDHLARRVLLGGRTIALVVRRCPRRRIDAAP